MMVVYIIKIQRLFSPSAVWSLVISMAGVAREPWARPAQAERAKDILTIHHNKEVFPQKRVFLELSFSTSENPEKVEQLNSRKKPAQRDKSLTGLSPSTCRGRSQGLLERFGLLR